MLVNKDKLKAAGITATVVFESSAVNRDEKIAESIQSIKKLVRQEGTFSFMSRAFIRHHLFLALHDFYGWQPAPVVKDNTVLQFGFPNANIVNYPELDLFGFMKTSPSTVTRKAPIGITKAVSLERWQGDMAFYANHDLVARAVKSGTSAHPNPFSKEEHYSLYKLTFTLDLYRFGKQETVTDVTGSENEDWLNSLEKISLDDVRKKVKRINIEEGWEWYAIPPCQVNSSSASCVECSGYVGVKSLNNEKGGLLFVVADDEYRKRLKQILTVIADGFSLHSSTESYGTNPLFFVMAALKLPVPLFHSAISFSNGKINADLLTESRNNSHIIKAWYKSLQPLSYELKEDDFVKGINVDRIVDFICPAGENASSEEDGA